MTGAVRLRLARVREEHHARPSALDALRAMLLDGRLRTGQRIDLDALSDQIGVSVDLVGEALRALEQERQVTYRPGRGYAVSELSVAELEEALALWRLLEEHTVRNAVATLDGETLVRMRSAARDCADAADRGDVASGRAADRRLHFALLDSAGQPHALRLMSEVWKVMEPYLALLDNAPAERVASIQAHDRIVEAAGVGDADLLLRELDAHRRRAADVLRPILAS